MSAEQTFTFVTLPARRAPAGNLLLSILLTPRLSGAQTLSSFPDVLHWPERIAADGLTFELGSNGGSASVTVDTSVLHVDAWQRVFTPTTFVEPFVVHPFDERLFVSYPVREAATYLKYAYQTIGTGFGGPAQERRLAAVLGQLVFRDGKTSTLDDALAQLRVELWRAQQHTGIAIRGAALPASRATAAPDGVPTPVTEPADIRPTISRFALFHSMPPAPNRPPLPTTDADFEHTLDFHRALSALASYPSLMRALGLVFDVEVPSSLCAPSPSGGTYGTVEVRAVTPGWSWSIAPRLVLPQTSYVLDANTFLAAPTTAPGEVASGTPIPGDVVAGVLALVPEWFHLLQVDLDGALLKALMLADNLANVSDRTEVEEVLPALRSAGIGLVGNGRAMQLLERVQANRELDDALTSGQPLPRALDARDLTRGYRIDVWSSRTAKWHSLHRRDAHYHFGADGGVEIAVSDEEGYLHPSVAQPADDPTRPDDPVATGAGVPQPGTDVFVHERIARWDGWSLSATRPGTPLNRSPDPDQATVADPTLGEPMTPFKLRTDFDVHPGTLPELRFGDRYRVRARAVDLAGNSIPLSAHTDDAYLAPGGGAELPYLRFEPVPPPLVVLRNPVGPGGSLERLVIRSYNASEADDAATTPETDERHVAPPRTTVRLAEQHGMFDLGSGHLGGDQSVYDLIVTRDRAELPTAGGVPQEPSAQLAVGYLPDPFARGAAFTDLPGAPDDSTGRESGAALVYATLPDVQARPGSVTEIGFGSDWPARSAFRVILREGDAAPAWDAAQRVLTVSLPKAATETVELSSLLSPADLETMGVWGWLRELFEAAETSAMASAFAGTVVPFTGDAIALLTRLALEGGHEMLTPGRTLTLVHAVQQPLGRPAFAQLPVVHEPAAPILASALRNRFSPITAWRRRGSHVAVLIGGMKVHGGSTARIDIDARWREIEDDPSQPRPTNTLQRGPVETIALPDGVEGELYSDASETRAVAVYVRKTNMLWFSAPVDELGGVATPSDVAAPLHTLPDTKHRWIAYRPVAASRFQEYFDSDQLDYTRRGVPLVVDVPSSARPVAPDVAYVVPTFGWERNDATGVKSSVRFGNGLRVYLNRPWYSSGVDELLGVVLWPEAEPDPDDAARETYKPYFTQWGADPIWASGDLNPLPRTGDFGAAVATASGLSLDETSLVVDVAGHTVVFDESRGLWYCDVELSNTQSYSPFVRLALARYQPHSIEGVELSRVTLADYAQLTPTRSAVLMIDAADPRRARVHVGGVAPTGPTTSQILVSVEQRRHPGVASDLDWEPAPTAVVEVAEDAPAPAQPGAALWSGSIRFAHAPAAGLFRVVIREFEMLEVDEPAERLLLRQRLVYAATFAYDHPTGT